MYLVLSLEGGTCVSIKNYSITADLVILRPINRSRYSFYLPSLVVTNSSAEKTSYSNSSEEPPFASRTVHRIPACIAGENKELQSSDDSNLLSLSVPERIAEFRGLTILGIYGDPDALKGSLLK
jgi:hypothetical protein